MRSAILHIFLLFLPVFSLASFPKNSALSAHAYANEIESIVPPDAIIAKITYDSDVRLEPAEFNYLMGIQDGVSITSHSLKKGLGYLYKKNKFASISLTIDQIPQGYTIHLVLNGHWTFKKLTLSGMLIGKEAYRQYYTMESGDIFDQVKHAYAVEKIKEVFAQEGYHAAEIETDFKYDYETKQVIVLLHLKRNHRFKMKHVHVDLQGEGVLHEYNRLAVEQLVNKHFISRLQATAYSKIVITKETVVLQRLLARNGYSNVDVQLKEHIDTQRNSVDLKFTLMVHQKKECVFTGNSFFSQEQLLDVMMQFGQSVSLLPVSMLAQEIIQMYHKKGFWKVQVASREEDEHCFFIITEGPRARVNTVQLRNIPANEADLLQTNCLQVFTTLEFYEGTILKQALDEIHNWYLKKGFWEVKVAKQEFVCTDEALHSHTLILTIDKGECSYLESMSIELNKDIGSHSLLHQLEKKDLHIPFDVELVHKQRAIMNEYFKKNGYKHVEIKPEVKRDGNTVHVLWKIVVDPTYSTFGKTVIVGNTKMPFEYIQRELCYKEGESWSNDALKDTFLRLKALEVFENIHLLPDRVSPQEKEKAVILKLQEDDPFEIRLRGGIELQQVAQFYIPEGLTYKLGGTFLMKSPFACGDQLRVDADFARVYREVAAKYQLPWLFNQPIKTLLMIYTNKYLQPGFVGGEKSIYDAVSQGFLAGFNRTFDRVDVGLNLGFEWLKTSIPDRSSKMANYINSVARAINFDPLLLNRSIPFFQVEPTLMIDFLDQKVNPTKGSFTLLSVKGMIPISMNQMNAYFVKALMEQSFFIPIKSLVLATRIRVGHVFFKDFKNVMPMERFYLGGANSLRSYDTDFAPPLGSFRDWQGKKQYVPQGGQSMLNLNMELRFPIYKSLSGVVFQDLGALSSTKFANVKPKDILAGTGFGIRVATPVGPFRFDIAWKWAKEPEARSYAWFLTFGQAF